MDAPAFTKNARISPRSFVLVRLPDTSNSETPRKLLLCSRNHQPEPNSHELFLPISFKFRPTANDYAVISRPNRRSSPPIYQNQQMRHLFPPSHPPSQYPYQVQYCAKPWHPIRRESLASSQSSNPKHNTTSQLIFYAVQGCRLALPTLRFWLWGSLRFCI